MGARKPSLIHSKFTPSLAGVGHKMSSSDDASAIFMTDDEKQVTRKVNRAFSGGGATNDLHAQRGGDTDVDVPFQYLSYFMEDDDELRGIHDAYRAGRMRSADVKRKLVEVLLPLLRQFAEARARVTDHTLDLYMAVRPLTF